MGRKINIGILAHVDAGKTTLSEAMLYTAGSIRKLGRVDKGDSFLDSDEIEKNRGITVFSKQASLNWGDCEITLLDTPGHDDFSAEMERTLDVIDYALLVVSGVDGVQSHTALLCKLLKERKIPTFVFINKMDLAIKDKAIQLERLKAKLGAGFVDFTLDLDDEKFIDDITLFSPELMEVYLNNGEIRSEELAKSISKCEIFPCIFGAALHQEGVDKLLNCLAKFCLSFKELGKNQSMDKIFVLNDENNKFSARIYKIARDSRGERLCFLRVLSGIIHVKDKVKIASKDNTKDLHFSEEKINQIRFYSGQKYEVKDQAEAGDICAVTGLSSAKAGMGIGILAGTESSSWSIEPYLSYRIFPVGGIDSNKFISDMKLLEEEDPKLYVDVNDDGSSVNIRLMGEIQQEILAALIQKRFGYQVSFDAGRILYKETIGEITEGVGHFEPLRHYAEVHLILEPGERGSGLVFDSIVPEDEFARNWQNLVISHLEERSFRGTLIGAPVADIKITLAAGKAHAKHTEGGDFRQATYRAVRNGLLYSKPVLLEPWFDFEIEVPTNNIGRTMTDIKNGRGNFLEPIVIGEMSKLSGEAPATFVLDYQQKIISHTSGKGRMLCSFNGYDISPNSEEVVSKTAYDPLKDEFETGDSVFCVHGAGHIVKWDEVKEYMHLPSVLEKINDNDKLIKSEAISYSKKLSLDDELRQIFERTYGRIEKKKKHSKEKSNEAEYRLMQKQKRSRLRLDHVSAPDTHFLVDGYNLINADEDMKELSKNDLGAAREQVLDMLSNYRGFTECKMTVVFDAYKVPYNIGSSFDMHGVKVIFTKENETADAFISELTKEIAKKEHVTVISSDAEVQKMSLGHGALRLSSREFLADIEDAVTEIRSYIKDE